MLLAAALCLATAQAAETSGIPALRTLADFPIGVAVPADPAANSLLKSPQRQSLVERNFDSLTAENIMKMAYLQPERGVFRFGNADALLDYASTHGMVMHGHALVWHNQTPAWLATLADSPQVWSDVLREHVQTVAAHYAGKLRSWDVVNEAFDDGAQTQYRDSAWYRHIGPGFIELAFRTARAADHDAQLFYNDYDIEGAIGPQKLERILQMADDFKLRGVPIDGIGFQMHIELDKPTLAQIRSAFAKVVQRNLLVRISELDISVNADKQHMRLDDALAQLQRARYREVMQAYLEVVPANLRGGVTVWGITDGDSWIPGFHRRADWPLLFDAEFKPKPALAGMAEALTARPMSGVLRIGTPGDYAPYSWYDTVSETYRGSDIELARTLALRLGLRPQFVATTWATLQADAAAGRFDVAAGGISITPERARVHAFSTAIASDRKQPVVRCGEQRRYDTEAEINRPQVRLIVNRGGTNERFAREHFPAATLVVHDDNRSVFDEIRAGRADVMVTDAVEGRLQQRAQAGLCLASLRAAWAPASKALLIPAGAVTKRDIDVALVQSGGAARYQRELSAWEGYNWAKPADPAVLLAALIDERLAIVTEVARAKWNTQAAIEDPAREQALLQSLLERAAAMQVPAARVEAFFRAQIEAAKVLQRQLFASWRTQKQGKFVGVADLARDIRPEIDRVTAQMLEQLTLLSGNSSRLPLASTMSMISPAALAVARSPLGRAMELK